MRDLLLGKQPKDFDVATDAKPEQVKQLFLNCRLIGRRFRLAHVFFHQDIIEVATFRGGQNSQDGRVVNDGMLVSDNVYGTLEEDAWRRDFTVNALYYNIRDYSIVDYTGGLADLEQRLLRMIGDPSTRYREDPVRMLRAVRLAAKLDLNIEQNTANPIHELGTLLNNVPPARLFDECLKLFLAGYALATFKQLDHYGLFAQLFPQVAQGLAHPEHGSQDLAFIRQALINTDERIQADKSVNPSFLIAALLWPSLQRQLALSEEQEIDFQTRLHQAMSQVLDQQYQRVAVPRRFTVTIKEIWSLQGRLLKRPYRSIDRIIEHPRFRAAYDFLLLRASVGEPVADEAQWWTDYQAADEGGRQTLISTLQPARKPRRRRSRRSSNKRNSEATAE